MQLTKFFTVNELQCPCCKQCKMDDDFLLKLEKFREMWGKPMHVSSGFRCLSHNKIVGGTPKSQHLCGKAVDILCAPEDRYKLVRLAFLLGFTGIGIAKDFVHFDTRTNAPTLWKY